MKAKKKKTICLNYPFLSGNIVLEPFKSSKEKEMIKYLKKIHFN